MPRTPIGTLDEYSYVTQTPGPSFAYMVHGKRGMGILQTAGTLSSFNEAIMHTTEHPVATMGARFEADSIDMVRISSTVRSPMDGRKSNRRNSDFNYPCRGRELESIFPSWHTVPHMMTPSPVCVSC